MWLGHEACDAWGRVPEKIEVQLPHKLVVL